MKIVALLLAAGGSSRFGAPKQFLELHGEPLLRRSLHTLLGSHVHRVMAVLGADYRRCYALTEDLPVERVFNPRWKDGMASSLVLGLQTALHEEPDIDAVLIALCDQPLINRRLVDHLIAVHHETGASMVACEYDNTLGPPALFAKEHFPALLELQGDEGARSLLREAEVARVPFPEGAVDIDRREQYEELVAHG